MTTPHGNGNNSVKNSHGSKGFPSSSNVIQSLGGQQSESRQGGKRAPGNKVRSFSQNQGSRKGISNILYNNNSSMS